MSQPNDRTGHVVKFPRAKKLTPDEERAAAAAHRAQKRRRHADKILFQASPDVELPLFIHFYTKLYFAPRHPGFAEAAQALNARILAGETLKLEAEHFCRFVIWATSMDCEPEPDDDPEEDKKETAAGS